MSKTYCSKTIIKPDPFQPSVNIKTLCEEGSQCLECKEKDENPPEPTPFEVLNVNGVPLIRHKNALLNMNNMITIEKYGMTLRFVSAGTDIFTNLNFNDTAEVDAAFDAIMGKVTPITKDLKDHKAQNKANEQSQAIDV